MKKTIDKVWTALTQAVSGVSYIPTSGFVIFNDAANSATTSVNINNGAFLSFGSSFTVTLTAVTYIGSGGRAPIVIDLITCLGLFTLYQ